MKFRGKTVAKGVGLAERAQSEKKNWGGLFFSFGVGGLVWGDRMVK